MTPDQTHGLYDPEFEHDSCGFGLIANIDGKASTWLVDQAFTALAKMSHRGGVNADGVTGDGCGVLIYRAEDWLRALAADAAYHACIRALPPGWSSSIAIPPWPAPPNRYSKTGCSKKA